VDVLGSYERQPETVVGKTRTHATARDRLPPVQHVAFRELVPRGLYDVFAHEIGARVDERQAVLQLVTEAERAA
jgi:hypothetical protein